VALLNQTESSFKELASLSLAQELVGNEAWETHQGILQRHGYPYFFGYPRYAPICSIRGHEYGGPGGKVSTCC